MEPTYTGNMQPWDDSWDNPAHLWNNHVYTWGVHPNPVLDIQVADSSLLTTSGMMRCPEDRNGRPCLVDDWMFVVDAGGVPGVRPGDEFDVRGYYLSSAGDWYLISPRLSDYVKASGCIHKSR